MVNAYFEKKKKTSSLLTGAGNGHILRAEFSPF